MAEFDLGIQVSGVDIDGRLHGLQRFLEILRGAKLEVGKSLSVMGVGIEWVKLRHVLELDDGFPIVTLFKVLCGTFLMLGFLDFGGLLRASDRPAQHGMEEHSNKTHRIRSLYRYS